MKKFIRENPTIAFGLGLPLLFVIVFSLAAALQERSGTPAAYDVIYAENYTPGSDGITIQVLNRKAVVTYRKTAYCCNRSLKLWRFSPATGALREIAVNVPPELQTRMGETPLKAEDKIVPIRVPELEALTLDNSSIAPDGYAFTTDAAHYGGGLFTELFFSARPSQRATLSKGWSRVTLPETKSCCASPHFIGWVLAP